MNIGRESEILEFKKSTSELKSAIKSISAILNKHNGGTLYFGVKDDGRVCGQQIGNDTLRDVSRSIRNYIKPECEFEVNLKHSYDNKEFIEVNKYFYDNFSNVKRHCFPLRSATGASLSGTSTRRVLCMMILTQ